QPVEPALEEELDLLEPAEVGLPRAVVGGGRDGAAGRDAQQRQRLADHDRHDGGSDPANPADDGAAEGSGDQPLAQRPGLDLEADAHTGLLPLGGGHLDDADGDLGYVAQNTPVGELLDGPLDRGEEALAWAPHRP